MRIHANTLTRREIYDAARVARVDLDTFDDKGSRKRDHAFEILLRGESRRAPNQGTRHWSEREYGQKAATWDQWGVFLAILFDADPTMVTPYDASRAAFHKRTARRFARRLAHCTCTPYKVTDAAGVETTQHVGSCETVSALKVGDHAVTYWPTDAHGDHTFRYAGVPFSQKCTKCSATQSWER
jgi:hypothetical protein